MIDTEQETPSRSEASRADNEAPSGERPFLTMPVIQEELDISKRVVQTGAIRLRKIVHEEVITVDEPQEFEVTEVERVPINRPVDGELPVRYEGDVAIYSVVAERLVPRKELVLIEEIRVTRRTRQKPAAPQQVNLRREEIVTERLNVESGEWKPLDSDAPAASNAGQPPAA
jgi:uncharacterized protein (TIGR02271 family)